MHVFLLFISYCPPSACHNLLTRIFVYNPHCISHTPHSTFLEMGFVQPKKNAFFARVCKDSWRLSPGRWWRWWRRWWSRPAASIRSHRSDGAVICFFGSVVDCFHDLKKANIEEIFALLQSIHKCCSGWPQSRSPRQSKEIQHQNWLCLVIEHHSSVMLLKTWIPNRNSLSCLGLVYLVFFVWKLGANFAPPTFFTISFNIIIKTLFLFVFPPVYLSGWRRVPGAYLSDQKSNTQNIRYI